MRYDIRIKLNQQHKLIKDIASNKLQKTLCRGYTMHSFKILIITQLKQFHGST